MKTKRVIENIKSKQTIIGTLILAVILIISVIPAMYIMPIKADEIYETQSNYGDFNYTKQITIDHTQVPGDLSGFPVLIKITDDSDMFSHCINDSGYDVAFFSSGLSQLPHEIEYWNWDDGNSEVDAVFWVNSSLSSSEDTTLYMCYGNDNNNQQDIAGTWDSHYLNIFHMNDDQDTMNNDDGTNNGAAFDITNSIIGNSADFVASETDYITLGAGAHTEAEFDDASTISFWARLDLKGDRYDPLDFEGKCIFSWNQSSNEKMRYLINDGTGYSNFTIPVIDTGVWMFYCIRYDGSDYYNYLNQTLFNTTTAGVYDFDKDAKESVIGANNLHADHFWDGRIDEVRISTDYDRGDNWVTTYYNNVVNGTDGGFFTFGTEYETSSTTSFTYNKQITIDHTQVDSALTNFPVLVNITDADLASHVENSSGYDIAFFNATNETQFNHEIELFNDTTGQLVAWVNVTSISSSEDTIFYMYYGNSTIVNQENVEGVWDSNYVIVHHMDGDAYTDLDDSTVNNNDVIGEGGSPDYAQTGKIGEAITLQGNDDDTGENLSVASDDSLHFVSGGNDIPYTFEAWLYPIKIAGDGRMVWSIYGPSQREYQFSLSDTFTRGYMVDESAGKGVANGSAPLSLNCWQYVVVTYDGSGGGDSSGIQVYLNGSAETMGVTDLNNTGYVDMENTGGQLNIGNREDGNRDYYNGSLDEMRMSNISRSVAWISASYNTMFNSSDGGFLTFGSEGGEGDTASSYSIKGLPSSRITWSGIAGNSVWCNSSGDTNEWLEINMSINSTHNVTEIRVHMNDLNDTSAWVNASNITMYVSSDNVSYGSLDTFVDGGSNLSINSTNWNAGTMGTNPFDGAGLTDKNASIYCIFKLSFPGDSITDNFYSAASDSFKIYIGNLS